MDEPARMLLLEFLAWLDAAPRTYGAVMDAWRTSCPRLPVWEEAIERDLIALDHQENQPMAATAVRLTAAGVALTRRARAA